MKTLERLENLLYGCAYYDEYMPTDRLEQDMAMMQKAGINVIRIAESTWATEEPQNGVFDFTHVERALKAAQKAGLSVIVGTPTYAIPPWLAAENPEVLAVTEHGKEKYGRRQNMDITSPAYRFYAERVIRKLVECVQNYSCVIGFQLDNETKHYNTAGPNVLKHFTRHLRDIFGTVEEMNRAFGFNYWSNRVDSWENLPDPTGSINGSYRAEFEKFRRGLVTQFLQWQADLVGEYVREDQFVTHNFDFGWRGHSYGVQPEVDHKKASAMLSIAGCDIYHVTQDDLSGKEIAFGGDIIRCLKNNNYLVIETEAQGHVNWTPYDGQLRLQAFSHLASGASAVMYWHWHSIHNAVETYWKGLLSHNLEENVPYREACTIGRDFARLSPKLVNLKKENKTAILVSNEALTALECFKMPDGKTGYNDFFRRLYDALYEMNIECDVIFPEDADHLKQYDVLLVPALYSAPEALLRQLSDYVKNGGHLVTTFKTGFTNEYVTVYPDSQPHGLTECLGVTYDQFTLPKNVSLTAGDFDVPEEDRQISLWMEMLMPTTAKTLAAYDHKFWGRYSAVTENSFGEGTATYIGCYLTKVYLKAILKPVLERAGVWSKEQAAAFPLIIKNGTNEAGKHLHYYFNYSGDTVSQDYLHGNAVELLSGDAVSESSMLELEPWGFRIFEEIE